MDIEDEFEFKPLTDGLGFHKKQVKLADEREKADTFVVKNSKALPDAEDLAKVQEPKATSDAIKTLVEDFPKLDNDFLAKPEKSPIAATLPRTDLNEKKQIDSKNLLAKEEQDLKVDPEIFNRKIGIVPEMKPLIEKTEEKVVIEKKLVERVRPTPPSMWSYVIDMLTVVGLSNIFMAALLLVTEVDVLYVLTHASTDIITKISVVTLLASVWLFYLLVSRVFFTKTLGEWAMDMQLGTDAQSTKMMYPIRISIRFIFNALTGIVLMPLISLIFRKDILGSISGVKTHKRSMQWE